MPMAASHSSRPHGGSLRVNHIEPLVGRGYRWGCCHHQENLETLCHTHHVEETTRQRRRRKAEM